MPDLVFVYIIVCACTVVICMGLAEGRANAYVSLRRSSQLYVWFDGSTLGAGIIAAEVHRRGGELVISDCLADAR